MEVWAASKIIHSGPVVRLRVGEVTLDNGNRAYREVVEHKGGVCVVPYTGHSVLLVRQFRIALDRYILEAPAGKIEGDENPEYRGRCEVEEEVGYRPGRLVHACSYYPTVGFCSEKIHLYLAFDLVKTRQKLDEEERIEVVEMPMEEVRRRLKANDFLDGKTFIGLHALINHLDGGGP